MRDCDPTFAKTPQESIPTANVVTQTGDRRGSDDDDADDVTESRRPTTVAARRRNVTRLPSSIERDTHGGGD